MSDLKVTLITPTGGRPEAFALCEKWVSRQTLPPSQWIVVDDCDPPTACTMGQRVLRPAWRWRPGMNTQVRNLLMALRPWVDTDLVLFWEDDDCYAPGYIEVMVERLRSAPLIGETYAKSYHVKERAWHVAANEQHASLSQTGFRRSLLLRIWAIIQAGDKFADMNIWRVLGPMGKLFPPTSPSSNCVGMKGMPGRSGIGFGHRREGGRLPWTDDPDLKILTSWIGKDAEEYARFRNDD